MKRTDRRLREGKTEDCGDLGKVSDHKGSAIERIFALYGQTFSITTGPTRSRKNTYAHAQSEIMAYIMESFVLQQFLMRVGDEKLILNKCERI